MRCAVASGHGDHLTISDRPWVDTSKVEWNCLRRSGILRWKPCLCLISGRNAVTLFLSTGSGRNCGTSEEADDRVLMTTLGDPTRADAV